MRIVELIREKTQKINFENFASETLEPPVRELKATLSQTFFVTQMNDLLGRFSQARRISEAEYAVAEPGAQRYYDSAIPEIGREVHLSDWHLITQDKINAFAEATQDKQWIHVDQLRARRESPFSSTIAQGFLMLSMIPVLRDYERLGYSENQSVRLVVNCGLDNVKFLNPVKPGKRIRARTILKSVSISRKSVNLTERIIIEIDPGKKTACEADILYKIYL